MTCDTMTPFQKLSEVIPGGVNSPVRSCQGLLDEPLIVERGFADTIEDIHGQRYIDYCGSWGALIHGHAHPKILGAVESRMRKGTTFGITTLVEEQLARKVVDIVDSIESVRFVNSGTEATMSAVRLARGFTKRKKIIKFVGHYHGHADFFLVKAGSGVANLVESSSSGIPEEIVKHTICLPFNDLECVEHVITDEVAAVILEPIAGNMGVVPADPEFITMLRKKTAKVGSLLIIDEVMTGFRVALKGAQSLYRVDADMTCLGKVVGGGFNAAAFGGKKEIMEYLAPLGPVYQAGTLSGNPLAMEAGLQALKMLEVDGFYEELERKTDVITKPVQKMIKEQNLPASLQQVGSMFTLFLGPRQVKSFDDTKDFDHARFKKFFNFMLEQGIYTPPSPYEAWFVSAAHTDEHLERTRDAIINGLNQIFILV